MSKYRELSRRLMRLTKNGKWQHGLRYKLDDCWDDDDAARTGHMIEGGFRYVGNGAYTWVFKHWRAPGVVFKVTDNNSDSMLEVAAAFKQLQHENLPVVHEIHRKDVQCPAEYWTEEDRKRYGVMPGQLKCHAYTKTHGVVVCEVLEEEHPTLTKWGEYKNVRQEVEDALEPFGIGLEDMHDGNMMWRGDTLVINDPTTWVRKVTTPDATDDEEF